MEWFVGIAVVLGIIGTMVWTIDVFKELNRDGDDEDRS